MTYFHIVVQDLIATYRHRVYLWTCIRLVATIYTERANASFKIFVFTVLIPIIVSNFTSQEVEENI